MLSRLDPTLPFDAWATHPYPTDPFLGPTQKVAYPNVTLTQITQFGESLQQWFHRRVPIWITEYGEQTKPEFAAGVSYAQQAADAKTALQLAAASPFVEMFVWFTIRDSPGTWQSGLFEASGVKKPAYAVFAAAAKPLEGQTVQISTRKNPNVKVYAPFMAYHDPPGATVSILLEVLDGKKKLTVQQENRQLAVDQSVTVSLAFKPVHGKQYVLKVDVHDQHGQHDRRVIVLQTT